MRKIAEHSSSGIVLRAVTSDSGLNRQLQKFWQREEVPGDSCLLARDEYHAVQHFKENIHRDSSGRYVVSLPLAPELG